MSTLQAPPLNLAPRNYQTELLKYAKKDNVIICLDTGECL